MAKKKDDFPKELFVAKDSDGDGGIFFCASESPEGVYGSVDEGDDPLLIVKYIRAEVYTGSRPFVLEKR